MIQIIVNAQSTILPTSLLTLKLSGEDFNIIFIRSNLFTQILFSLFGVNVKFKPILAIILINHYILQLWNNFKKIITRPLCFTGKIIT